MVCPEYMPFFPLQFFIMAHFDELFSSMALFAVIMCMSLLFEPFWFLVLLPCSLRCLSGIVGAVRGRTLCFRKGISTSPATAFLQVVGAMGNSTKPIAA